jgi:hypothetical protein
LSNWDYPTRVEGSDGQWVTYTWTGGLLTRVDYSDGTSATYIYGDTTYL